MNELRWAEIAAPVTTLGPGRRVVLWVQGCDLSCPGCIAPDWQVARGGHLEPIEAVARRVLAAADAIGSLDGLTLSGGEPLQQPLALLELWRALRSARASWTLVLFTGYRVEELMDRPAAQALVQAADLVVDGRYVQRLNDGRGLRGSVNQRLLLRRPEWEPLRPELERGRRRVEVHAREDGLLLAGVPPRGLAAAVSEVAQ